jgi:hypothetical protein
MKEVIDYKNHTFKIVTFINNGNEWHYYVCKYCKIQFGIYELEDIMGKYSGLNIMEKHKCISDEEKLRIFLE